MIFDTHAHYDDEAFDNDRETILYSLKGEGIGAVVNVAASMESCHTTLALTAAYDFMYGALGVHPGEVEELTEEDMGFILERSKEPKIVAIGEIGLDYYWPEPSHEFQKKWFARQLALAKEAGKPLIIHSRDAAKDTLDIMRAERAWESGGIIHCYSYSKETAREYLDMGFSFGIGGVLTFKNAKKLKEAVEYIPMSNLVLETDCPYLAPVPFRGKRNSSLYLPYVVDALSQIKGVDAETVVRETEENAKKLFRLV